MRSYGERKATMTMISRVKTILMGNPTDGPFQTYYGALLRDRQEGGPNAQEARRDFENVRQSVSRISVY
jgi:hypothetical protein